jgi:hypothetical protein
MRVLAPRLPALLVLGGLALLLGCSRALTPAPAPSSETACGLSVDSLSFGTVRLGNSADRTFTIKNTGSGILAGVVGSSKDEFAVVGTVSYALDAGESLLFTVRFTPKSTGPKNATIATGLPACPRVLASGMAQTAPGAFCDLSPTMLDFGSVELDTIAYRAFTIRNAGDSTLSGSIVQPSCTDFAVLGSLGYTLAPGESAAFAVRFRPTTSGVQHCSLSTGSSCSAISLDGTSPLPACEVSPAALAFDTVAVGSSEDLPFTIKNIGGGRLTGTVTACGGDFTLVGPASYDLGPADTARFTVHFAPTTMGSKRCTINTGSANCSGIVASGFASSGIRTGDILVADGVIGLILVNPTTGVQHLLVSGRGGYDDVVSNSRGEIFALAGAEVDRIDPSTGAATQVAYDVAHLQYGNVIDQAPGGMLYVLTNDHLVRVDPATGAATFVAGPFTAQSFAVVDDQTGYLQIGGALSPTFRIDLTTGAMTGIGSAGLNYPRGLVQDADGNLLVASDHSLYRINPTTGSTAIVSAGFAFPRSVATEQDGQIIVVDYEHQDMTCDPAGGPLTCAGSVYRVDPTTGSKTVVTHNGYFFYPYNADAFRGPTPAAHAREPAARAASASARRIMIRSGARAR